MFSLRELVREVVSEKDEWLLGDLVEEIMTRIPDEMCEVALRQALHEYARINIGRAPTDFRPDHSAADAHISIIGSEPTGTGHKDDDAQLAVAGAGGQTPAVNMRNSRVALLRRSGYREKIHVGTGLFRSIVDCTGADLLFAAAENRRMAKANTAAAERYEKLEQLLRQHRVQFVRDVPEHALEEVLQ